MEVRTMQRKQESYVPVYGSIQEIWMWQKPISIHFFLSLSLSLSPFTFRLPSGRTMTTLLLHYFLYFASRGHEHIVKWRQSDLYAFLSQKKMEKNIQIYLCNLAFKVLITSTHLHSFLFLFVAIKSQFLAHFINFLHGTLKLLLFSVHVLYMHRMCYNGWNALSFGLPYSLNFMNKTGASLYLFLFDRFLF